jgi:hypothetical protein
LIKHLRKASAIFLVSLFLSACARQSQVELTLVATQIALNTQIAAVRNTATVQAERIQVTVEYMATQVRSAEVQNDQLRATLVARGIDPQALTNIDPSSITPLPPGVVNNVPQPEITGEAIPPITPTPGGAPALTDIVTSENVGNDDCAVGVTSTFSASAQQIYVVATALNIQPGTTIVSRWQVGGQEIVHDFTPDFEINQNCIWFFIDQVDTTFTPGNWNVQLEINGSAVGTATFSITE